MFCHESIIINLINYRIAELGDYLLIVHFPLASAAQPGQQVSILKYLITGTRK